MKLSELKLNTANPRFIRDEKFKKLLASVKDFPKMMALRPIIIDTDGTILGGNMRYRALVELGFKDVPDSWVRNAVGLTDEEKKRFIVEDNVGFGEWDWDKLANEWDAEELSDWGVDIPTEWGAQEESEQNKKLSDRFIIPLFSVLDTKQGDWQQRKNYWLSLGIKSEEGRDAECLQTNFNEEKYGVKPMTGTSIFDPVLCELAYKWFNIPNGKILDCFAGGSVRGIVAAKLGYEYLGNDLRSEQITANRENAKEVLHDAEIYPTWTCGDSLQIDTIAKGYKADLVFSCPPYADLEVYSDMKEDISNMPYNEFLKIYREIIRKSCEMLNDNRFAVFVVGDVRDKNGFYRNFVSDTIMAFSNCGVLLYNEMILVNSVGTLAIRAGRQFAIGRKAGKQHQNVLVFYKGDPKKIKENYPELDLSYLQEEIETTE